MATKCRLWRGRGRGAKSPPVDVPYWRVPRILSEVYSCRPPAPKAGSDLCRIPVRYLEVRSRLNHSGARRCRIRGHFRVVMVELCGIKVPVGDQNLIRWVYWAAHMQQAVLSAGARRKKP